MTTTRLLATAAIAALAFVLAACGGSTAPEDSAEVTVIQIRDGEPVGGVTRISVESGDTVRFVVEADAPEEVHVHGFDVSKDVGPGKDARFAFTAEFEGVFEVELEESAVKIAEIEVRPS